MAKKQDKKTAPFGAKSFKERLKDCPDFVDLTREIEETGTITNFKCNTPAFQELEKNAMMGLYEIKVQIAEGHDRVMNKLKKIFESPQSKDLNEMSFETVIKLMERLCGRPLKGIEDLFEVMSKVTEDKLQALIDEENGIVKNNRDSSANSLFDSSSRGPSDAASGASTASTTSIKTVSLFPSTLDMIKIPEVKPSTPTQPIYKFESKMVQRRKSPRTLKPGELIYSESGSPVMLPRGIPVSDSNGKKFVEVVLVRCPGAEDKDKAINDVATDIRGLIATKSIKQDRVGTPRVAKCPGSATKSSKRFWH